MATVKKNESMLTIARDCMAMAKAAGAQQSAANVVRVRDVTVQWRDGKPEQVTEATTQRVVMQLFVDGRYSSVGTSDLRAEALKTFIGDSIALAKALAPDPFRGLADPESYKGQASVDLKIDDPKYDGVTADQRRKVVAELEEAARSVKQRDAIQSVTTIFSDTLSESFLVTSNGFSGVRRDTQFWLGANVSVKDADGRKPEDSFYAGARFLDDLPNVAGVGREAGERAVSRLGSKKGETAAMTIAIDPRAAGRMIAFLMGPLSGASLQQKRSFLEGKSGQQVGSARLSFTDDPLVLKGFASRLFDGEGMAAKVRPIFEDGVLRNYYIDTYYGRKMKMPATTGSASNLTWKLGSKSRNELLAEMKEGLLITGFLGGNSNGLTGDFSLGIQGYRVRNGAIAEPVAEMNMSGNHLEFWNRLAAVGNDPFPYSSLRTPTLVFEGVSVAGS